MAAAASCSPRPSQLVVRSVALGCSGPSCAAGLDCAARSAWTGPSRLSVWSCAEDSGRSSGSASHVAHLLGTRFDTCEAVQSLETHETLSRAVLFWSADRRRLRFRSGGAQFPTDRIQQHVASLHVYALNSGCVPQKHTVSAAPIVAHPEASKSDT